MAIPLTKEPEPHDPTIELCCFCYQPTRYWYAKKDVAVCQTCAKSHRVSQVPSKAEWWDAVKARAFKEVDAAMKYVDREERIKVTTRLLHGKDLPYQELPADMGVQFHLPDGNIIEVALRLDNNRLCVRALDGRIQLTPSASNAILLHVDRGW